MILNVCALFFFFHNFIGQVGKTGSAGPQGPSGPQGEKGPEGQGLSGVSYVRWGRTNCSGDANVVYSGKWKIEQVRRGRIMVTCSTTK